MGYPIITGNWKMNKSIEEAEDLTRLMKPGLEAVEGAEVVVCPPFVSLAAVRGLLEGSRIRLGAQNMHYESDGAFTGEVSAAMLAGICQFVIVGHSERRQLFCESDAAVSKKVLAAQRAGLRPIMCVGESLEERDNGHAQATVEEQVRLGLARVTKSANLLVAYEPVWAIGTGRAATPEDAQAMMVHIRRTLAERFGDDGASGIALLYGGSVRAENVADFVHQHDVDGALVGGASLDAHEFVELVRNAASA